MPTQALLPLGGFKSVIQCICAHHVVCTLSTKQMVVHDAGSIAANFSGAITWLAGLGVREWGKLGIHMAVGLAIWTPVISLVWYICWSLDNCQTEALRLLYASYVLLLLLHLL